MALGNGAVLSKTYRTETKDIAIGRTTGRY